MNNYLVAIAFFCMVFTPAIVGVRTARARQNRKAYDFDNPEFPLLPRRTRTRSAAPDSATIAIHGNKLQRAAITLQIAAAKAGKRFKTGSGSLAEHPALTDRQHQQSALQTSRRSAAISYGAPEPLHISRSSSDRPQISASLPERESPGTEFGPYLPAVQGVMPIPPVGYPYPPMPVPAGWFPPQGVPYAVFYPVVVPVGYPMPQFVAGPLPYAAWPPVAYGSPVPEPMPPSGHAAEQESIDPQDSAPLPVRHVAAKGRHRSNASAYRAPGTRA